MTRRAAPQPPCSQAEYRALVAAAADEALRLTHACAHGPDLRAAAAFRPVLASMRERLKGPGATRARGRAMLAELDAGLAPRPSVDDPQGEA